MFKQMKCNTMLHNEKGFTLMEVLMAMVIAAVGLTGLAMMQGYAIEGNDKGNKYLQATYLAQRQLEAVKNGMVNGVAVNFDAVDMVNNPEGTVLQVGAPENVDEEGNPGGEFTRSWDLASYTQWSRLININVQWTDNGIVRNVTLTTASRGDGT
jgi:prepilin-type N-terminal cleavage/methylation domain-containing protein